MQPDGILRVTALKNGLFILPCMSATYILRLYGGC